MQKNSLMKRDDSILRVLECRDGKVLVIDCKRLTMPVWVSTESLQDYVGYDKEMNTEADGFPNPDTLTPNKTRIMHKRFTAVAGHLRSAVDSGRGGLALGNEKQFGREKVNLAFGKLILPRIQEDVHVHPPGCPVNNQFLFSL